MSSPYIASVVQIALLFLVVQSTLQVQVTISNGPIQGEVIKTNDGKEVSRFLGIQYGQAPVGKLRFRRPKPISEKWTEPFQATNWPVGCVQFADHPFGGFMLSLVKNKNISEDCLFLNVWSPNVKPESEEELLPVIVWIHGGALILGSSSFEPYDGETLASKANAVVVTINYRLSALGFMVSTEVPEISGNQGLWDQALALEWVQENIRYFGGNPSQVTIMGESAGSWSVSAHILSPVSRDLFSNAIMLSGAVLSDKVVTEPANYETKLLTAIRKVKCASDEDKKISAEVLECLEQLDAAAVDQIYYAIDKDPFDLEPIVVVDGSFFPAKPQSLLSNGDYKTNVNLIASTVEDEGSFVFSFFPQFNLVKPEPLPLDQAKQFFVDYVSQHYLYEQAPSELITKVYFAGLKPKLDPENSARARIGIAFGDLFLGCPTIEFAKEVKKNSNDAHVYQLHYRAKLGPNKLFDIPWTKGACHGDDIWPAFGVPIRQVDKHTNRERDVSAEFIDFIGAFAKTGKPGPTHSEWLDFFKTESNELVTPYYELSSEPSTPENYKFGLKQLECGLIWNKYNIK